MEQHVQEAASRNASQRGAKAYNSCICLPGYALLQDYKKGGRIVCCAQVLRDFWVDLLSLHDINKTYLNTAAFASLGQESFFTKTPERHLRSGEASEYGFYFRINSRQLSYCFPFLVQPYATQAGFFCYFRTDYWGLIIQCWYYCLRHLHHHCFQREMSSQGKP